MIFWGLSDLSNEVGPSEGRGGEEEAEASTAGLPAFQMRPLRVFARNRRRNQGALQVGRPFMDKGLGFRLG